ncbi:MAG: hypothetical protein OES26_17805 [Gammaproteobacteria bacterium]|nr:hypothetical protein [Gammaproteobacteria bacterium]
MVKPAGRKRLVGELQKRNQVSQRRVCRVIPICRKAVRYAPLRSERDSTLVIRLKALGERYPRFGYLLRHEMLKAEGLFQNRKRTYRLHTELGMQVKNQTLREAGPTQGSGHFIFEVISFDRVMTGNVIPSNPRESIARAYLSGICTTI